MKAIQVQSPGGPEVLQLNEVPLPEPGAGEIRVRFEAIGVNFIDVYHRMGLYPLPTPFTPGMEGAGVVDAVGEGVEGLKVGDRVAYAMERGTYAEAAIVGADRVVRVPDTVSSRDAAAVMLQGMTADYLTRSTYPVQSGDRVLIHAAAGGVGLLLVQMAKALGATVYGTVSTEEKAALAREAGADEVILYTEQDFAAEVERLTDGKGVNVVYDSVGQATFEGSLRALAPRGTLALFGQSSGSVEAFDPQLLNSHGSLFLTRPSLAHYVATPEELQERADRLFTALAEGSLKLRIDSDFPLADAAAAHRHLESRASKGKLLLIP